MKEYILSNYNCIMHYLDEKRSKFLWINMIIYKIVLELFYILAVSPRYAYEGMIYEGKGWKYLISWVFYIFMVAILPKSKDGLKETFLHLQFVISIAPLTVFYFAADKSSIYFIMVVSVVAVETYILCKTDKVQIGINVNKNIKSYVTVFMIFFILGLYLIITLYGGFWGLKAFDFVFLYMIRDNASYPYIVQYIIGWMPIIIQFFLLYYLEKKKYIVVIGLFIIELLLYMTLGHKFIYLSLAVTLCVYIVRKCQLLIPVIYTGLSGICMVITIMFMIEKPNNISELTSISNSLMGERFLFGPALNKFLYYECFSEFPKVGFSDGWIGKCFGLSNAYKGSMGQTAYAYLHKGRLFDSTSNTGYLGDSYGQAGFIGMLIIGILLAFFVRLICNIGQNLESTIVCSMLALLAVNLNDSAFISLFLTSGWAVLVVLLIIYANPPKDKVYRRKDYEY